MESSSYEELPQPVKLQQASAKAGAACPFSARCRVGGSTRCAARFLWRCIALPALVLCSAALLVSFTLETGTAKLASSRDVKGVMRTLLFDTTVLLTGTNMTAEEALEQVVPKASALLVVTLGPTRPTRRPNATPFLTVAPEVPLPTRGINAAAAALEQALGRNLFALRIEPVDMPSSFMEQQGLLAGLNLSPRLPPVAIWEVGSGRVLVDRRVVTGKAFWGDAKVQHMFDSMATQLFTALTSALRATSAAASAAVATDDGAHASSSGGGFAWPWRREDLASLMGPALALAVSAAFAAAPPLWFCVVCPAVLGLLAPLLINIGLNQLAGWLCVHFSLPDDQCFDLLVGALGLGFVLALASAIPIFFVCRLKDCANRGGLQRLLPAGPGSGGCHGGGDSGLLWQWLGGGRKMMLGPAALSK